jgi:hypothetical protein
MRIVARLLLLALAAWVLWRAFRGPGGLRGLFSSVDRTVRQTAWVLIAAMVISLAVFGWQAWSASPLLAQP